MYNNREKNVKFFGASITDMAKNLLSVAFAEESDSSEGEKTPAPEQSKVLNPQNKEESKPNQINYEDLISRARKEEKEKLYNEIKQLKLDLKAMTKSNNENLLKIGTLETDLETLKSSADENPVVKQLKEKIATLEADKKTLEEAAPPDEDAIRTQIKAEYDLELFKIKRLAEDDIKNDVLPMFIDTISGTTEEEINASIEEAKNKTVEVKKQLGVDGDSKSSGAKDKDDTAGAFKKPPVTNPADPNHSDFEKGTDWDYVKSLDPRSPEYAEWRKKVGLR